MIADLVLVTLAGPVVLGAAYVGAATLLSAELPPPPEPARLPRFVVVVPAHDEAPGIAATVGSLLAMDYPPELFRVLVVADNCTDETARVAAAAGASVLERVDPERRGKGHALHHAFERLPGGTDAVVVVDADTVVSPNLLRAFAARLEAGAEAVQADYGVRNPSASYRTRLMAVALGAFHVVRSRARERLRFSAGLRGNGMCFAAPLLQRIPHDAFSLVEDVEYGIRLGRSGVRVWYADEAKVLGEMVSEAARAGSQRVRWEGGRVALRREHARPLLRDAWRRRDLVLLDLALDLLVPPLSTLALGAVGLALLGAGGALVFVPLPLTLAAGLASSGALVGYVLRGWSLSGTGLVGLRDLALAPIYVARKLWLRLRAGDGPGAAWVRTARERPGEGA